MDNLKNLLTKKEKELLSQIVADNESGGHLLRKRTKEYQKMRQYVSDLKNLKKEDLDEKQKCILEYCVQISDYHYWSSLPVEKRLF